MRKRQRRPALAGTALTLAAALALTTFALPGVAQARTPSPRYYVSLGDSYSVGYQPTLGATPGYTSYVAARTHLTLVNFGCSGATTTSLLDTVGCPDVLPHTAGGTTYPTSTQIAAAEAFLTAHRGHIGLVTVTIGVNDVIPCALKPDLLSCVLTAVKTMGTNVTTIASDLRGAAGRGVPIIGSTYPDVVLGGYVWPSPTPAPSTLSLAKLSVTAFRSLINPTLATAYAHSGGFFVDVTAATGAYGPLTATVHTKTYGTIPVPVAAVCVATWFCARGDIHPRTAGYTLIGRLIVARDAHLREP